MDKEKLINVLRIVLIAVLAIAAVFGYDVGVLQPRAEQQNAAIAALTAEVQALGTGVSSGDGSRSLIERAGVLDTNGDGITGWNGSDVNIYSDGGTTPKFTVDGATGNTWTAGTLTFEGATPDAYETAFAITDPTADRTITIPNSSGTVALNPYGASIEFEGATADAYETTLTVVDPTADRTLTLPNLSGTVLTASSAQQIVFGSSTITGTLAVTHGLTTPAYAFCTLAADSTANGAGCTTVISGSTVTVKTWKADGSTAGDAGLLVNWFVAGTP